MKNSYLLLGMIIVAVIANVDAIQNDIRKITTLREAYAVLDSLDEKALVVFDVDETLIVSIDKIRRKNPEAIINAITKIYFDAVIQDILYREYLQSIKFNMAEQKLVEPESVALISALQSKNIRVIALTHMHAGVYYTIENMEEWRYKQLYDLGIDLSIHNPMKIVLTQLPMGRNSYPVLHKGIVPTSKSCSKGQVLAGLIEQLGYKPSRVVFFDDYLEHVCSVQQEMDGLGIPCTVFHYVATEHMQEDIDVELAIFQYKYLITHEKWLSDVQAREFMSKL